MIFSALLLSSFLLLATQLLRVAAANPAVHGIDNNRDVRYTAPLTIGGQIINVTLDTGSNDLWLDPRGGIPASAFMDTRVKVQNNYGDGGAFINGTVGLAAMSIAGYKIPLQAFINVTTNVGLSECGNGICGLVGLGFDNPDGGLTKALTKAGMKNGPAVGKSVLSSIFDLSPTPDKNRFFGITLSRLHDDSDTHKAALSIGEYDPDYTGVRYEKKRPVFPKGQKNWHILTDGVAVNGTHIDWLKKDASTPAGSNRISLDTGVPNILMLPEVRDLIYGRVPGAVLAKNSSIRNAHWSSDRDVWIVPCTTAIEFSAIFGGQKYPIHPLDMTTLYSQVGPDGVNHTICAGAITNGGSITSEAVEAVYGDSFLRNVYTLFSFGDKKTAPFVQLMPLTRVEESQKDFNNTRKRLLASYPREIPPAELIRIFDGPASDDSSASSSSGASNSSAAWTAEFADTASGVAPSTIIEYGPVLAALLGANLLLLAGIIVLGVLIFLRKGSTTPSTRSPSIQCIPANSMGDPRMRQAVYDEKAYCDRLP
ncbi:aspartic peptidase domain-containing protein [Mycena crocata]|nr:aspartic peptidase domain-containing protein [Mycena crocata]